MNTELKLNVTEIQRFCMHDGPGVRTTVFFKGCPLRCAWCHNPETQRQKQELLFYPNKCIGCRLCEDVCSYGVHSFDLTAKHTLDRKQCAVCGRCVMQCPTCALELCGRPRSIGEILTVVEKDRAFYGDLGGITLSGGEPLMQGEAVIELLKACKERGLSTVVETCGYADEGVLREAARYVDLFLWDVKDTNDLRHKEYTGVSNKGILKNLAIVNGARARIRLRCILVNGINTDETHYQNVAELARGLVNFDGVEWIPYHAYGGTKAVFVGGRDTGREEWIPSHEQIRQAVRVLKDRGVAVTVL